MAARARSYRKTDGGVCLKVKQGKEETGDTWMYMQMAR